MLSAAIAISQGLDIVEASSTTIASNGLGAGQTETVYGGGIARHTTVGAGAVLVVSAQGKVGGAAVHAGGTLVAVGGSLSNVTIAAGGTELLNAGVQSTTTVRAGDVFNGGTMDTATIGAGGFIVTSGTISGATLSGGALIATKGTATNVTIGSGGVAVASGGFTPTAFNGASVRQGGMLEVFMSAAAAEVLSGVTVSAGGTLAIVSGADAVTYTDTTIASGGTLLELGVKTPSAITIASGAVVISADGVLLGAAPRQAILSAGNLFSGGTVTLDDTLRLYKGGIASGLTISGTETIGSGAAVHNEIVANAAGAIGEGEVANFGTATGIEVFASATFINSAVLSGATIFAGGVIEGVSFRGESASGMVVSSGGSFINLAGNPDLSTIISFGGIESAGQTNEAKVMSGGVLVVLGDRVASGATLFAGGALFVSARGTATATTVQSGGFAQFDSGSKDVNTVLATGGTIDAASFVYAAGGSATLSSKDVLTVSEGGHTYTLQLAGSYAGDAFVLGADSGSGTLITLSAATAASAGAAGELVPAVVTSATHTTAPAIGAAWTSIDQMTANADLLPHIL